MKIEQFIKAKKILEQIEQINFEIKNLSRRLPNPSDCLSSDVIIGEAIPEIQVILNRCARACEDALLEKKKALELELSFI